jgi:small GTP-binding protein
MKPSIAIVTSIPVEFAAARSVLEDAKDLEVGFSMARYVTGKIRAQNGDQHEIVLLQLGVGMVGSEVTLQKLMHHFPGIDTVFAVGIGAAVPTRESEEAPARLGDIVVSGSEFSNREDSDEWQESHAKPWQSERLRRALHTRQFAKGQEYFPYETFNDAKSKLGWDLPDVPADVRIVHGTTALLRSVVSNLEFLKIIDRKIVAISPEPFWTLRDPETGYLRVLGICDEATNKQEYGMWQQYSAVAAAAYARSVIELMYQTPMYESEPIGQVKVFDVPSARNIDFIGREAILRDIHNILCAKQTGRSIFSLGGVAGIGKTQVALQYAYEYRDFYDAVFWVSAASRKKLQEGLVGIAKGLSTALGVGREESDTQSLISAAMKWLRGGSDWLMVVDNAEDETLLEEMLLSKISSGHFIIASRKRLNLRAAQAIELQPFTEQEVYDFLQGRDKDRKYDRLTIGKFTTVFGGNPLALTLADAYLRNSGTTLEQYLQLLSASKRTDRTQTISLDSPLAFQSTVQSAITEVAKESAAAIELLRFTALLDPACISFDLIASAANKIGLAFVKQLEAETAPLESVKRTLEPLVRFSIVHLDAETDSFSIHTLVHDFIKHHYGSTAFLGSDASVGKVNAKVIFVGAAQSGKTSLISRLLQNRFYAVTSSSRGVQSWTTRMSAFFPGATQVEGQDREIAIWDFAGQRESMLFNQMFVEGASTVVLVFDARRGAAALDDIREWNAWVEQHSVRSRPAKLLVSTRVDVSGVNESEITNLCNECGVNNFITTSAKEGLGINELYQAISDSIDWSSLAVTTSASDFRRVEEIVEHRRESGDSILYLGDLKNTVRNMPEVSRSDEITDAVISRMSKLSLVFRGDLPDGRVALALNLAVVSEYALRVLRVARIRGMYSAAALTRYLWGDDESAAIH